MRLVGPPCTMTISGGSSPSSPSTPVSRGSCSRPCTVRPSVSVQDHACAVDTSAGSRASDPAPASTRGGSPSGPRTTSGSRSARPRRSASSPSTACSWSKATPSTSSRCTAPVRASSTPSSAVGAVPPAHQCAVGVDHREVDQARGSTAALAWSARVSCSATGPEPVSRCTVHQPDSSDRNHRAPSGPKIGCTHRDVVAARDDDGVTGALLGQLGPEQLGGVPRHARVAPGDPGQRPAVGGDRRAGDEVAAGGQHHAAVGVVAVQVEPHELVGRLGVARVVLAHREHVVAVQHQATEAARAGRRDRHGLARPGIQPVHAVVAGVREHDRAVLHRVAAPAVLVHPRADVPRGRQHLAAPVPRPVVPVVPDQRGAPALAAGGPASQ